MGAFGRFFMGTPGKVKQQSTMTGQQQQLANQNLQQGMQNTDFNGIQNLETKRIIEQTIPSIMSRFMAHGQNQNSSAMQSALGGAGADLGAQLASLRSQYGLQQSQLGMQPQFENVYQPGQEGMLQQMAGPVMQAGLAYATGGLSGMGAMGRGAMDAYRGMPSGKVQSAYQNLFGPKQQGQQQPMGGQPMQGGAMQGNPFNRLQAQNNYNFDNLQMPGQQQQPMDFNNMTPGQSAGYNLQSMMGTGSQNPYLNQDLSGDPSLYNALGRGASTIGRGVARLGKGVGRAGLRVGRGLQSADTMMPY